MKKLFLTLVASVLCITGAQAQEATTLVATLSHDGSLSAYYGKSALADAYSAAHEGDVITLSAGTFTAVNMSKNITVRGAGMWADAKTGNTTTYIEGSFSVKQKKNDYEFTMEGLYLNDYVTIGEYSNDVTIPVNISKCYFKSYLNLNSNVFGKISQCVLPYYSSAAGTKSLYIYDGICQNCVIFSVSDQVGISPVTFQNCVIKYYANYSHASSFTSDVILTNCLLIGDGTRTFGANANIHSCVGFCTAVNSVDFFANVTHNSNKMVSDRENFFKNTTLVTQNKDSYGDLSSYSIAWEGLRTDGTGLFELSDEAKQIYKGNDGTVVGVWGGTTPFNMTPTNPRISKCDIVPKVDASGKLSVTIEVAQ